MGVQHLWSILEGSKREESVHKLRNKTLCIDLSLWICEAHGTKGLKDQLKPYLRNVFFRTLYLASLGVRPVFVVDGVPPEIKRETIVKRLQARGATNGQKQFRQKKISRSRFTAKCNECCEMMRLLGIPFVKSDGEAEAMCAWLNENNYADGVLTDDGDVFLYGAKVVYKDFNVSSSKKPTDELQMYTLTEIETNLGLTRRNMIALGLLLGCDYLPAGVPGVGKETAVRLLSSLPGVDLLDRFHEWKSSPDVHPPDLTALEVAVKRKAVKVSSFPNKAVIQEFLCPNVGKANVNLRWRSPDLEGIKEFFSQKLEWPKEYTEEKMLILATDWQLAHMNLARAPLFFPARIVKPRVKQGKEYYEIEWNSAEDHTSMWPTTFNTIKAKEIMCRKFPALIERFETEQAAKESKGRAKKNQKTNSASNEVDCLDDLSTKMNCLDLIAKMAKHDRREKEESEYGADRICVFSGEHTRSFDEVLQLQADVPVASSYENDSPSIVDGPRTTHVPALKFERIPDDCFYSPAVNEKTMLNLADMTMDQTFGSDLEAVDDLLTESFISSLQNATPIHDNRRDTKRFQNSKALRDNSGGNILFESNNVLNDSISSFDCGISFESLQGPNITLNDVHGEEPSIGLDVLDEKENICEDVITKDSTIDTPSSRERTSLASRLLKRFQGESRTNMTEKLRCISGEGELVSGNKEISKQGSSFVHLAEQSQRFASEIINEHKPFTNLSNRPLEKKSSKASDVIVLD